MKQPIPSDGSGWLLGLLSVVFALAFPFISSKTYYTSFLTSVFIQIMLCSSLNLILGYTGQLSLTQGGFLGIGAYSAALLTVKVGMNFWPAMIISIAIVGVVGFFLGIATLRLRGHYFVVCTLGFNIIVGAIVLAWTNFTGGGLGLSGIPRVSPISVPLLGQLKFESLLSQYYLILVFTILVLLFVYRIRHSLVGRSFVAIMRNEDLSESIGVNIMQNKVLSFTISAAIAGLAGTLYAPFASALSPTITLFLKSFDAVVYLAVGGIGTIAGTVLGPLVLLIIGEALQNAPHLRSLFYGIILIITIAFLPIGMVGGLQKLCEKVRKKRS